MARYEVVNVRVETEMEEQQRKWFEQQVIGSPAALDEAARLLIGLVTGLLGVLFGVLAISKDPLPAYLRVPAIRGLGAGAVVLFLLALLAALVVVLPRRWTFKPAKPASQAATFEQLRDYKERALTAAVVAFGFGIAVMAIALVLALLTMS